MLSNDHPIVQRLIEEAGHIAAGQFVSEINNACVQMAGFEDAYQLIHSYEHDMFFAPPANMSHMEH